MLQLTELVSMGVKGAGKVNGLVAFHDVHQVKGHQEKYPGPAQQKSKDEKNSTDMHFCFSDAILQTECKLTDTNIHIN